jgi:AcrR family transcriptional regulator
MNFRGEKSRETILNAAVKLLESKAFCKEPLIRDIAKTARVSDGSPNYYFGSKDNLINEAIYKLSDRWLETWFQLSRNLNLMPVEKIRVLCKNLGDFYAEHPNVIKISLNNDLFRGFKNSVRARFINEILIPITREAVPKKTDDEIKTIVYSFADTFDMTFLRAVSKHPDNSFNFFYKPNRDKFIDRLIDYSIVLLQS